MNNVNKMTAMLDYNKMVASMILANLYKDTFRNVLK